MHFITCFDDRWMDNTRRFVAEAGAPAEYHAETASRCFGYFAAFERARQAVANNEMDLHERLYTYCVIEYLPQGIHPAQPDGQTHWFRWTDDAGWQSIEQPACTRQILGFALG